jgi:hypothetical protein
LIITPAHLAYGPTVPRAFDFLVDKIEAAGLGDVAVYTHEKEAAGSGDVVVHLDEQEAVVMDDVAIHSHEK